jgi:hypothetical protein
MIAPPVRAYDVDTALAELAPGTCRVALLPMDGARILLHLGYGGFNDCPGPHVHARVWQHWAETLGAEPAVIGGDTLTGIVTRPIATREALVRFAREAAIYDLDAIAPEGWLPFLGGVFRSATVRFWWD